jgi:hypothetical protein
MPDKWEYPWYAAWDLAFHCIPLALIDSDFAKEQLILMLREWYMHPNGQIPAYEWALGDVNPPVQDATSSKADFSAWIISAFSIVARRFPQAGIWNSPMEPVGWACTVSIC